MDKAGLKAGVSAPAIITRRGFSEDLTYEDRQKLRAVVRKKHATLFRDPPTDVMCDQLIDAVGPTAWVKMMNTYHGEPK